MPEHQDNHGRKYPPLLRTYSLAASLSDDEGPFGVPSPESDDPLWFSLVESPPPYVLDCPQHTPLTEGLAHSQPAYVEPSLLGAMYSTPTPSCPHYPSSPPSHPPLQNAFHSPPVPAYQLPLPQIAQPAITVSDTPPGKGLPRCALPGTLDPTTGIFYRNTEHRRVRTAQACEKCRTRKAKCSGDHPTCQRCRIRGLTCHYTSGARIRGPNKPKLKSDSQLSINTRASSSGSPSSAVAQTETARHTLKTSLSTPHLHQSPNTETGISRSRRNTTTNTAATSTTSATRKRSLLEMDTDSTIMRFFGIPETVAQVGVRHGSSGDGVESSSASVRTSRTPSTSSTCSVITRSNSVGLPKTPDSRDSPFGITPPSPQLRHNHDTYLFGTGSGTIGINTNYTYPALGDVDIDEQPGVFGEYLEWREVKEELHEGRFFS